MVARWTLERFGGQARRWTWSGVLLTLAGCGWVVASLSAPWAVDGPHAGVAADQDGWEWMPWGSVMLALIAVLVVGLVAELCFAPAQTHRDTRFWGVWAFALLGTGAAGAAFVWWLTGWDFIVMDDDDLRHHGPGAGAKHAVAGLAVAALGVACAMAGRLRAPDPGEADHGPGAAG